MNKLNSEVVNKIVLDCLFSETEISEGKNPKDAVLVKGVIQNFGFHPTRLESHRAEVTELCQQLSSQFMKNGGGGWSFLNLPFDKDGNQWGEQRDGEALYVLAAGLGMAKSPIPRELWNALPGGVPYLTFDLENSTS